MTKRRRKKISPKKEIRQKEVKYRKNFLPTILIVFMLWVLAGGMVFFVEPSTFGAIPLFFFIVLLACVFTFSILFANSRRGFLISVCIVLFLVLRYFGIGNLLNLILLVGVLIAAEIYLMRN